MHVNYVIYPNFASKVVRTDVLLEYRKESNHLDIASILKFSISRSVKNIVAFCGLENKE